MTVGVIGFGNPRSRTAYERYVQGLEASFKWREIVDDPTYVLADDVDLYAKIRRDPVFAHALDMRKRGAAGREWTIEPASKSPADRTLSRIIEQALKQIEGFTTSRFNLAEAIPRGSAYARINGAKRALVVEGQVPGGPPVPEMVWWVPVRLIDVDRRRFRLARELEIAKEEKRAPTPGLDVDVPVWHFRSIARSKWEPISAEEMSWFLRLVYGGTEDTLGYGRGLLEALYFYAAAKTDLLRSGLEAAERFGQGIVTVAMDRLAQEDVGAGDGAIDRAAQYRDAVRRSRKDGVLTFQKGDELNVLQGLGEGWSLIQALIDYIDSRVVTCALGANLPTLADKGGSFALGAIQQDSQQTVTGHDVEGMSEAITNYLMPLFMRLNRPQLARLGLDRAHPGKFSLVHEVTAADPAAFATTVVSLAGAGMKIREKDVRDRVGLTEPMPGDALFGGQAAPAQPQGEHATAGGVAAPPGGGAPSMRVLPGKQA